MFWRDAAFQVGDASRHFQRTALGLALLVLMILMAAGGAKAATNVFVTLSPLLTPQQVEQGPTAQQIEAAQRARESRPAAQDPEGHWGETVEGFQLSVRFEQESFRAGEPIVATVLIRNATGRKVFYRDFVGMKEDSPVCQFDVLDEQQQPVPRLDPRAPKDIEDGPHMPRLIMPGTQCRYEVKLETKFKLGQPGKYTIRARRWVHHLDRDGYAQLHSGPAVITILKAANGSDDKAQPNQPPK